MKKFFKLFFNLVLALVAVAVTLIVIFFFNEKWQKRAADEVVLLDARRDWQIAEVRLRPHIIQLEGLFVLQDGIGAQVEKINLRGPFWRAPFDNKLHVESGKIDGLFLDLNNIPVSDLISTDYETFLRDAANDPQFWQVRVQEWMQRIKSEGIALELEDVVIGGSVLFPGDNLVPVNFRIIEADTAHPLEAKVEPTVDEPESLVL